MSKLSTVHSLIPAFARSIAATVWGHYLKFQRYGPETERLVEEAIERESWSREQWREWQEEQLARTLFRAVKHVPYYREQWSVRRQRGDRASWYRLENWPLLDKNEVRNHARSFVADDYASVRLHRETTSGSTGSPVPLWLTTQSIRAWYALAEARWRRWNGISRHDRWAMLGAQKVVPLDQRTPPFWVWNHGLHQLYMSAYHLSPDSLPLYLEAIAKYRVNYIWGHTSAIDALARALLSQKQQNLHVQMILSSSEPVSQLRRRRIEAAFGCPIVETYGMCELLSAASECKEGNLHMWPETGWVEMLPLQGTSNPGPAELVITGFLNEAMPLIRYRVGDLVSPVIREFQCPCGRRLPMISGIEGRSSDSIYTVDGRLISPSTAEAVFDADLRIQEGQIIQESLDSIRIRYVPDHGFGEDSKRLLIERMQECVGRVNVVLEPVSAVPRGPNCKFRAVLCNIRDNSPAPLSLNEPTPASERTHLSL